MRPRQDQGGNHHDASSWNIPTRKITTPPKPAQSKPGPHQATHFLPLRTPPLAARHKEGHEVTRKTPLSSRFRKTTVLANNTTSATAPVANPSRARLLAAPWSDKVRAEIPQSGALLMPSADPFPYIHRLLPSDAARPTACPTGCQPTRASCMISPNITSSNILRTCNAEWQQPASLNEIQWSQRHHDPANNNNMPMNIAVCRLFDAEDCMRAAGVRMSETPSPDPGRSWNQGHGAWRCWRARQRPNC